MGGIGSGGQPGVGQKPKDQQTGFVHGQRGAKSSSGAATLPDVVPMPADLTPDQAEVWSGLADHARQQRTLAKATAQAFRDLCAAIVSRDRMAAQVERDGLTYLKVTVDGSGQEHTEIKAHPLVSQHRGMMQRVEAGMTRFRLAPVGKEFAVASEAVDPFDEFEDGETVQ